MSDLPPLVNAVSHPAPLRNDLPRWRIVLGLVLAPSAFALQVVVSYALAADACGEGGASLIGLAAINLVALALIIVGLGTSIANYRRTRSEGEGSHRAVQSQGDGRSRFLAYFGLCTSGVFALAVLVQLTSILVMHQCLGLPTLP
ncbi:hypothetical protein K3181_02980 [Qipengyuania sp. YG27]|uniref:DUF202 domain-containing protein n=1 Tax=Qipengyuania mesophila TaxID=2867246 RepID=A0ABS7JS31_9SPHN|nr:hypothetical protein [Qipengyuania mesophila]MBX7500409.1 hypothetical protein [Qipengyuania mesophila]